jgi:hypothetical protein
MQLFLAGISTAIGNLRAGRRGAGLEDHIARHDFPLETGRRCLESNRQAPGKKGLRPLKPLPPNDKRIRPTFYG